MFVPFDCGTPLSGPTHLQNSNGQSAFPPGRREKIMKPEVLRMKSYLKVSPLTSGGAGSRRKWAGQGRGPKGGDRRGDLLRRCCQGGHVH